LSAVDDAALAALRAEWGPPPEPRAAEPQWPGISLRSLATLPDFGSQLLLYGIGALVAQRHHLALEAPDWVGRDIFRLDDPLPADPPRPPIDQPARRAMMALDAPAIAVASDHVSIDGDLAGSFDGPTGEWARHRSEFCNLFGLAGRAAEICDLAWNRLANQGYLIVAIDTGHREPDDHVPLDWYRDWLEQLWPELPGAALYVAGNDAFAADALHDFGAIVASEIADAEVPGVPFLVDWAMLAHADILGIANSRLSFVASMLNPELKLSVRPDRESRAMKEFDPWDAPLLPS